MQAAPAIDELFIQHLALTGVELNRAMERCGLSQLILHAGSLRTAFQDDQTYPFRPNPWFCWLTPVHDAPDSLLVWTRGERPRLILVMPDDYWHSPPAPPQGAWTTHYTLELHPSAAAALARLPAPDRHTAWLGEPAPPPGDWQTNPATLLQELEDLRTRKSPYELACLRQATRLAVAGHIAVAHAAQTAPQTSANATASEYALHLTYLAATAHTDAELPYPNIIGYNEHAATLHYQHRDRLAPTPRRNLLIDAGASHRGYAADITRTWPLETATQAGSTFATLVQRLDALQQQLCAAVRPGLDWRDLHLTAHHDISALLREAGVLRMTPEAAVAQGVSATFLPHGLGHLLGLQVHDVGGRRARPGSDMIPPPPGHPWLRATRRLEPGFVVTVEPGIYFVPSLLEKTRAGPFSGHVDWNLVDALRPYGGARIEDNVHVTANGQQNLTRPLFASAGPTV